MPGAMEELGFAPMQRWEPGRYANYRSPRFDIPEAIEFINKLLGGGFKNDRERMQTDRLTNQANQQALRQYQAQHGGSTPFMDEQSARVEHERAGTAQENAMTSYTQGPRTQQELASIQHMKDMYGLEQQYRNKELQGQGQTREELARHNQAEEGLAGRRLGLEENKTDKDTSKDDMAHVLSFVTQFGAGHQDPYLAAQVLAKMHPGEGVSHAANYALEYLRQKNLTQSPPTGGSQGADHSPGLLQQLMPHIMNAMGRMGRAGSPGSHPNPTQIPIQQAPEYATPPSRKPLVNKPNVQDPSIQGLGLPRF